MNRYPISPTVDYCYHPIHVVDNTKDVFVPCGKCDGCLLHKANEWSMRVGMELEATPFSIFFTLTYNNYYLPKLRMVGKPFRTTKNSDVLFAKWTPYHEYNVRFNSVMPVVRNEMFGELSAVYEYKPIQNFVSPDGGIYMCYSSKRDVQLWLKLLRKDLIDNLYNGQKRTDGLFRYFVISEYGPTTFRSHYHGLIFPKSEEIAKYLIEYSLYKNWAMCDKARFDEYTHFADSGVRGYVTNYITSFSSLPELYKINKDITPFRLSSKSPAIGFIEQKREKIFEDVYRGVTEYTRTISRLGMSAVLKYPENFMSSLFPKCKGYGSMDFPRILAVYGRLFKAVRRCGLSYDFVSRLLSALWSSQDYAATRACYTYCVTYDTEPFNYCYLVDMYWYKRDMSLLKTQYQTMESVALKSLDCRRTFLKSWFTNFYDFVSVNITQFGIADYVVNLYKEYAWFADMSVLDLLTFLSLPCSVNQKYQNEVSDIIENSTKMAKYNEMSGNSPHIV